VNYELGFCIPEDDRRGNLKSYKQQVFVLSSIYTRSNLRRIQPVFPAAVLDRGQCNPYRDLNIALFTF
jgi:hypothetical protein